MRQYLDAKQQHRDAILFFRMGDFYEMFYEDALVASRALDLTLTSRSKDANGGGIPMCGVPFHAVDGYIARLVRKGFRVAICDQVEDPRKAKGIVKREVVRVVSPGTLTDASYLDAREPAFLMAVAHAGRGNGERGVGVALLDVSTGEFTTAEYHGADGLQALADELAVIKPREIVTAAGDGSDSRWSRRPASRSRRSTAGHSTPSRPGARSSISCASPASKGSASIGRPAAVAAAGALVHYLKSTQKVDLAHVRSLSYRQRSDALLIDPTTLKHLEILEGSEGGRDGSLLAELDRTITAVGSRTLRAWLLRPLLSLDRIRDRLDAVEELAFRTTDRGRFRDAIKTVQDLERLVARVVLGHGRPARLRRPEEFDCRHSPRQDGAVRVPGAARLLPGRRARRAAPTCGTASTDRSSTIRRRSRARAATSATASTLRSTSFGRPADPASRSSRRWRRLSAREPGSRR